MEAANSVPIPELFAENAAWMRRLARSLLADESKAEDALQDTWLELLRRPPPGTVSRGWLHTVLRNFTRKRHRQDGRRARREHAAARVEAIQADPREIIERVEVSHRLVSLVLELAEPYRSAILLRFFEDLRPVDIARRQGVPVTTVSSRVRHALDVLRTRLERERPGTWKALLVLIALQGAAGSTAVASGVSAGLAGGGSTVGPSSLLGNSLVEGAILMSKKAVLIACLSATAVLSGGFGFWYAASTRGDGAELRVEDTAQYKDLLAQLRAVKGKLDQAARENASLVSMKNGLESKLAALESRRGEEATKPEELQETAGPSRSGLDWDELSSLIAGNVDVLAKLARSERLDPAEQAQYDLLAGELLKLSSKAKQLSKDPFLDESIFRELVSALFTGPLSLGKEQQERLDDLMGDIFEGLPESLDGMDALDRYKIREDMASRLEAGIETVLDGDQKQDWEAVRSFANTAFTYGGKLTLGTSAKPRSLLVNWLTNALEATGDDTLLEAATPVAEEYLERAKTLLSRYAATDDALKDLSPEAKAALEGQFLNLQKLFYEEMSPHLSEELRRKLQENDPLIIRFEFGQGTSIWGRRRYF